MRVLREHVRIHVRVRGGHVCVCSNTTATAIMSEGAVKYTQDGQHAFVAVSVAC